jgi:hypothetical protein
MQGIRNRGDSLQCSLLFIAALRFSMCFPKPMSSTPITEGKIFCSSLRKMMYSSTGNGALLCERNLFSVSSILNHNILL